MFLTSILYSLYKIVNHFFTQINYIFLYYLFLYVFFTKMYFIFCIFFIIEIKFSSFFVIIIKTRQKFYFLQWYFFSNIYDFVLDYIHDARGKIPFVSNICTLWYMQLNLTQFLIHISYYYFERSCFYDAENRKCRRILQTF